MIIIHVTWIQYRRINQNKTSLSIKFIWIIPSYRFQRVLNNRVNLLVQNSVNRPKPDYRKRIKKKLDILTYFIFHSSWYNFYNIWHKDHSESCNLLWRLRMAHLIIKWAFSVSRYDISFYYIKIKSKGNKATSLEKKQRGLYLIN